MQLLRSLICRSPANAAALLASPAAVQLLTMREAAVYGAFVDDIAALFVSALEHSGSLLLVRSNMCLPDSCALGLLYPLQKPSKCCGVAGVAGAYDAGGSSLLSFCRQCRCALWLAAGALHLPPAGVFNMCRPDGLRGGCHSGNALWIVSRFLNFPWISYCYHSMGRSLFPSAEVLKTSEEEVFMDLAICIECTPQA